MSRLVRIGERMIELQGLHGIWLGVDHLSNSRITLFYPKGPTQTIEYAYGKWADAERDRKILEDAKALLTKAPHSEHRDLGLTLPK